MLVLPPQGIGRLSLVCEGLPARHGPWEPNTVLFDWGTIAAKTLGLGDSAYKLAAMYVEFENNGGAAVTTPTVSRDQGVSYYNGLSSHPTRDYLRVSLLATTLDSTDLVSFPLGNQLTLYAQTAGSVGVHGKTFSDGVQSRVYGFAVVATPEFADAAQDLVYARLYLSSGSQQIKLPSSQVGATYVTSFG